MSNFDKHDLSGFVGKHLVYTYDNGWNYELYIKNENTIDYRIHSGIVGNRWVKDQRVYIVRVGENIYKISWTEPTGTDVSLIANLGDRLFHGTIFFPRWAGPAYPTEVIDEFATITFVRDCAKNDESVIACPASELPADFPNNLR